MRVLFLHSDDFSYNVTGDTSITKYLDPIPEELTSGTAKEVLVCMMAVEKGDNKKTPEIIDKALAEIIGHCEKVNCTNVLLYPYAHLSSSLESPGEAVKVLDLIYQSLANKADFIVSKAPFGVYKEFAVHVKGHPLSEMGRNIEVGKGKEGEQESDALKAEKEKKSEWLIMMPDGTEHSVDDFDFRKYPHLQHFFDYEQGGSRISEKAPPHIKLMREHELVDYEEGSDGGNFRWYPKGYQIKKLMEEQTNSILNQYGAMQVETPIMYDLQHPALSKYLNKFPARQYQINSDKGRYFLRFAACFGQYLMKHDMSISYKHLPLRLYELTHYSFRREQSGELTGLKRLRSFTMPDMHTLCADVEQTKLEMLKQVDLSFQWWENLEYEKNEYAVALRAVKDFYKENPDYVKDIAKRAQQPILIELWDERYFYFITKFEINFIDTQNKASALSTVQIDVENPKSFDISYKDQNDAEVTPLMLHTSIPGSIDRNIYALLEKQARKMDEKKKANFPFWLAPIQIRFIPIKGKHVDFCTDILSRIKGRVDIDDRDERLNKKIRDAEKEWIPLIIVVGDKEMDSDSFTVRIREQGKEKPMDLEKINNYFAEKTDGKVWRPLNLPKYLSLRPVFRG